METNENEHTKVQYLWDITKALHRGDSIAIQAYLKKIETFQTNSLALCLQEQWNNNRDSPEQAE